MAYTLQCYGTKWFTLVEKVSLVSGSNYRVTKQKVFDEWWTLIRVARWFSGPQNCWQPWTLSEICAMSLVHYS